MLPRGRYSRPELLHDARLGLRDRCLLPTRARHAYYWRWRPLLHAGTEVSQRPTVRLRLATHGSIWAASKIHTRRTAEWAVRQRTAASCRGTFASCARTAGNAADAQSHRDEYESSREPPDCLKCLRKSKNKSPCRKTATSRAAAVQRAVCSGPGSGWASIPYRSTRATAARRTPGRFSGAALVMYQSLSPPLHCRLTHRIAYVVTAAVTVTTSVVRLSLVASDGPVGSASSCHRHHTVFGYCGKIALFTVFVTTVTTKNRIPITAGARRPEGPGARHGPRTVDPREHHASRVTPDHGPNTDRTRQ